VVAPFDYAEPKAPSKAEGLRSGCYHLVFGILSYSTLPILSRAEGLGTFSSVEGAGCAEGLPSGTYYFAFAS